MRHYQRAFMKKLLAFLIIAFSSFAQSEEIKVSKMTKDGELERSFVLETNLNDKVVIDCQSFIQGLRIGQFEAAYTYLLEPDECEGLQERIRRSLRSYQKHCIDVQDDIRSDRSCD